MTSISRPADSTSQKLREVEVKQEQANAGVKVRHATRTPRREHYWALFAFVSSIERVLEHFLRLSAPDSLYSSKKSMALDEAALGLVLLTRSGRGTLFQGNPGAY